MLGSGKKRVNERVDDAGHRRLAWSELGALAQGLSGGQARRVGVARALGADPAVMLMDEPFGAIDPITRDRSRQFLRLPSELEKTIVFVTHDVDEAIRMRDRIAVLGERSVIRRIDTPSAFSPTQSIPSSMTPSARSRTSRG